MKKAYLFLYRPLFFGVLVVFLLIPLLSHAETKYISGVIVVNVRDTNEKHYKTLTSVETGDQVEVLEEKGRMAKIKTKDNIEGWIPTQYLRNIAPAMGTITKLKEELAELKKKNERDLSASGNTLNNDQKVNLNQTIDNLKSENERLLEENQKLLETVQGKEAGQPETSDNAEVKKLREKVISLQNQLDSIAKNSKNIIQIVKERDTLRTEAAALQSELAQSRERTKKLETNRVLHWFFAGAAVFFLGFLSSKLFVRKKSKLSF